MKHILPYHVSSWLVATLAVSTMLLGFALSAPVVSAHSDPALCDSTGVSLSLTVLRADGTTPVGAGTVTPGETIKYRATLSHGGGSNCNYEGGDLDIVTPDAVNHDVDGGAIPLVDSVTPFVGSLVIYVVDSGDVVGGFLNASAVYSGGTSHLGGNVTPVGATTPAATVFEKLDSEVTTEVHNPGHVDITNQSVAQGTTVHDEATVGGSGPAPTGTVTFALYGNGSCDQADFIDGDGPVAVAGGVAESTGYPALAAGSYSFLASYSGDNNYNGDVGICEPFMVVQPLVIEKTAVTSYDREWDWTINKTVDDNDLELAEGESFTVNYDVTVNASSDDINHMVSGTITVTNPIGNPAASVTGITDDLDVTVANPTVDCSANPGGFIAFPHVLAAGESLVCTYSGTSGGADTENTATVTTTGSVPGGSDDAAVNWGAPTNEIDECADVTDPNELGGLLTDTICADEVLPHTYEYDLTFGPDGGAGVDVPVSCGALITQTLRA